MTKNKLKRYAAVSSLAALLFSSVPFVTPTEAAVNHRPVASIRLIKGTGSSPSTLNITMYDADGDKGKIQQWALRKPAGSKATWAKADAPVSPAPLPNQVVVETLTPTQTSNLFQNIFTPDVTGQYCAQGRVRDRVVSDASGLWTNDWSNYPTITYTQCFNFTSTNPTPTPTPTISPTPTPIASPTPTPTPSVTPVLGLQNASFEQTSATPSQALAWQPFGDGYQVVSGGHTGSSAISATNSSTNQLSGAYQRIDLNQTSVKPVFIGAYVKGSNIVKAPNSWFGASIYAEIHLQNGTTVYWNSVSNDGTFDWRWIGFNTGTVAAVNQPISYIFIVPILGNASGSAYFDDVQVSEFAPTQGAITLMFDDGELNTYTVAKPYLDIFRMKGTSAVVTSYPDDDPDFMTWAQIKDLYAKGWEIVSHSVDHNDLPTLSAAQAQAELANSKSALAAQGINAVNFAFPSGAYNGNLLALAAQYYQSARAYELGDNPQGVFPFDVKVRSAVSTTSLTEFQSWIDSAKNNKRWEVIVFHSIAATGDDIYHTSPSTLVQMLQKIYASGMPVITYNQGIQQFAVK